MEMRHLLISIMLMVCSPATSALTQSEDVQTEEQSEQEQEQEQHAAGTRDSPAKQPRLFATNEPALTFMGSPLQPGSFSTLLRSTMADYRALADEPEQPEGVAGQRTERPAGAYGAELVEEEEPKATELDAQMAEVVMRVDKRAWQPSHRLRAPGKAFRQRQEMIHQLLEELPQLNIETGGPSTRHKVNAGPQGRSALAARAPASSQSTGGDGGGGGNAGATGSGLPKRTSSRHQPCYFNAISCF